MLPPVNAREMMWLEAFLNAVEWMEGAYPELAREVGPVEAGGTAEPNIGMVSDIPVHI